MGEKLELKRGKGMERSAEACLFYLLAEPLPHCIEMTDLLTSGARS